VESGQSDSAVGANRCGSLEAVSPLLVRVERTCNDEISLLLALTICLGIAGLTEAVGLSLALGAFLAGLFLGNSPFTHKAGAPDAILARCLRGVFLRVGGDAHGPEHMEGKLAADSAAGGAGALRKICCVDGVVWLFRYRFRTAFRVGLGLTQIGEFSFILAQVSMKAGFDFAELIPRDAGGFADYDSGQRYDFSLPETASRKPTSRL